MDQDEHGLPIRLPLECVDSVGASVRRGSGNDGGDVDGGCANGFVSEDPPTLMNEGTRNNTITTACDGFRIQAGKANRRPGCTLFIHDFYGASISRQGHGHTRKCHWYVRNANG